MCVRYFAYTRCIRWLRSFKIRIICLTWLFFVRLYRKWDAKKSKSHGFPMREIVKWHSPNENSGWWRRLTSWACYAIAKSPSLFSIRTTNCSSMRPRIWIKSCWSTPVSIDFLANCSQKFSQPLICFAEYDQPHESQTNKDIMEAINRKGLGGLCGPDSPEGDGDYPLHDSPRNDTPHTNDNEYQSLVQNRNQLNQGK